MSTFTKTTPKYIPSQRQSQSVYLHKDNITLSTFSNITYQYIPSQRQSQNIYLHKDDLSGFIAGSQNKLTVGLSLNNSVQRILHFVHRVQRTLYGVLFAQYTLCTVYNSPRTEFSSLWSRCTVYTVNCAVSPDLLPARGSILDWRRRRQVPATADGRSKDTVYLSQEGRAQYSGCCTQYSVLSTQYLGCLLSILYSVLSTQGFIFNLTQAGF